MRQSCIIGGPQKFSDHESILGQKIPTQAFCARVLLPRDYCAAPRTRTSTKVVYLVNATTPTTTTPAGVLAVRKLQATVCRFRQACTYTASTSSWRLTASDKYIRHLSAAAVAAIVYLAARQSLCLSFLCSQEKKSFHSPANDRKPIRWQSVAAGWRRVRGEQVSAPTSGSNVWPPGSGSNCTCCYRRPDSRQQLHTNSGTHEYGALNSHKP